MADLIRSVKNGVGRLIRWAFENDKVCADPRFVSRTSNYRR